MERRAASSPTKAISLVSAILLAASMMPAVAFMGLAPEAAYAAAPRPAQIINESVPMTFTAAGDASANDGEQTGADGASSADDAQQQNAQQQGNEYVSGGVIYRVAEGANEATATGFDLDSIQYVDKDGNSVEADGPVEALAVAGSINTDDGEFAVTRVAFDEGQVAPGVARLTIAQTIEDIDAATLGGALPDLVSIVVENADGADDADDANAANNADGTDGAGNTESANGASSANSTNGAYSTYEGALYKQEARWMADHKLDVVANHELIYVPVKMESLVIPVECEKVAEGAFANASALNTIIAWGDPEIANNGDASSALPNDMAKNIHVVLAKSSSEIEGEYLSADVALSSTDDAAERTDKWVAAGFSAENIQAKEIAGGEAVEVEPSAAEATDDGDGASSNGANSRLAYTFLPNGTLSAALSDDASNGEASGDAPDGDNSDKGSSAIPADVDVPSFVESDGVRYRVANAEDAVDDTEDQHIATEAVASRYAASRAAYAAAAGTYDVLDPSYNPPLPDEWYDESLAVRGDNYDPWIYTLVKTIDADNTLARGMYLSDGFTENGIDVANNGIQDKLRTHFNRMTVGSLHGDPKIYGSQTNELPWYNWTCGGSTFITNYGGVVFEIEYRHGYTSTDSTWMNATKFANKSGSEYYSTYVRIKTKGGTVIPCNGDWIRIISNKANGSARYWVNEQKDANEITSIEFVTGTFTPLAYDLDGGTASSQPGYHIAGTSTSIPDPTRAGGYAFAGWTYKGQDTPQKNLTLTDNMGIDKLTLKANWIAPLDASVAISDNGDVDGTIGSFDQSNVTFDKDASPYSLHIAKEAFTGKGETGIAYIKTDANGNLGFYDTEDDAKNNKNVGLTLSAKPNNGYHFAEWKLGNTALDPNGDPVAISKNQSLTCSFASNDYTLTLYAGVTAWGGESVKTIPYSTGNEVSLDKTARYSGFWLSGWVWTDKESSDMHSGLEHPEQPTFTIPAGAYGNASLRAVWTPQKYVADYDVSKSKSSAFEMTAPDSEEFVSQIAVDYVDNKLAVADDPSSGKMAEWGKSYKDQPGYTRDKTNAVWIDTSSIDDTFAHKRDLAGKDGAPVDSSLAIPGYEFRGWTKNAALTFNYEIMPDDLAYELDESKKMTMAHAFDGVYDTQNLSPENGGGTNHATLYGVWRQRNIADAGITLGKNGAPDKNNEGKVVTEMDGRTVTPGTEKIYYWQGRGLISSDELAARGTSSPKRNAAGEIGEEMGLVAPVRYGFEFLGWGVPAASSDTGKDQIFISYNEDTARDSGNKSKGFALTQAGVDLMYSKADADPVTAASNFRDTIANDNWQAIWKIREVKVTFRIPSFSVDKVDMTGESTKAGHATTGDGTSDNTKYEYTDDAGNAYCWREGNAEETGQGSSSGWYIAERTWKYYDLLEYPAFTTQKDRYTYDGWYDQMKPSLTDSTDKALEDMGDDKVRRVAGFEALRMPGRNVYVTGNGEGADKGEGGVGGVGEGGLTIGESFFTVGDPKADSAGQKTLWLWTSPIRINVAAPIGVYLCTTNSYGQQVAPFVVGNDRRTQLEAQAEFQVATNSHDLQLVGVTAEDISEFDYQRDENGAVVRTDDAYGVPVVDSSTVKSGEGSPGIADKILNPKFTSESGNYLYNGGKLDPGNEADPEIPAEGSRMFWISPVPTATADQTGVVYSADGTTAATEADKVKSADGTITNATSNMTDEEKRLQPDVEKRRYFGFGYRVNEGAEPDNRIEDVLDSSTSSGKTYMLEDFVLRRDYVDGNESGRETDGLARTKVDEGSGDVHYRFYYGLDMRRADFDLSGLQEVIENNSELEYNSAFDQPLLRVKFTFAAARNNGISYFSLRESDDAESSDLTPVEDTVISVGSPS